MGRVARILSFVRVVRNKANLSDVKADPGGGLPITAEHFSAPGDDSHPLPGDSFAAVDQGGTGRESAVGYVDTLNEPKSAAGEKRIYARDADTGLEIVEVWLKNDGTGTLINSAGSFTLSPSGSIKGVNGSGSFELQSNGTFLVNGVSIDPAGNVTSPTSMSAPSVKADGKELTDHDHKAGTPPGDTGPNQ